MRRGHANLLCIVPILTDDPRRESGIFLLSTRGSVCLKMSRLWQKSQQTRLAARPLSVQAGPPHPKPFHLAPEIVRYINVYDILPRAMQLVTALFHVRTFKCAAFHLTLLPNTNIGPTLVRDNISNPREHQLLFSRFARFAACLRHHSVHFIAHQSFALY